MMNSKSTFFFLLLVINLLLIKKTNAQVKSFDGINITGMEKTWRKDNEKAFLEVYNNIKKIHKKGVYSIRIPIDLDHQLNHLSKKDKKKFLKTINKINKLARKKNIKIVYAYFNHQISNENWSSKATEISNNWIDFLKQTKFDKKNIYVDLLNEPTIHLDKWHQAASILIKNIQSEFTDLTLIYGETNYNSMFELSRSKPLNYQNIIYKFHFYEPFIFTHQGTEWTGKQNATTGIPFPHSSNQAFPPLHPNSIGTEGEINYQHYHLTGNETAILHKLTEIKEWANKYQVEIWCTEFGVTKNASEQDRINYLRTVSKTLKDLQIKGFVWEFEGNFGVNEIWEEIN